MLTPSSDTTPPAKQHVERLTEPPSTRQYCEFSEFVSEGSFDFGRRGQDGGGGVKGSGVGKKKDSMNIVLGVSRSKPQDASKPSTLKRRLFRESSAKGA
jgi:hypothetical protein